MFSVKQLFWKKNIISKSDEPFLLSSGQESNIYIDCSKILSSVSLTGIIIDKLRELILIDKKIFTYYRYLISGVPSKGTVFASMLSYNLEIPMILLRKESKSHGCNKYKMIEGKYEEGEEVILVEDIITTGKSVKKYVEILRDKNLEVKNVYCIVIRDESVIDDFKSLGIKLSYILTLDELLEYDK